MINLFTIYKFKTPFFILSKEKTNLEKLYKNSKDFLSFQWIQFQVIEKETVYFKNYILTSPELEIVVSLTKNINNIYMPLLLFDVSVSQQLLWKIDVIDFSQKYFENFDWLREKSYILDWNREVISGIKLQHDFLDLDFLYKKYSENKKIISLFEKILLNRKNITQIDFLKIEENFLYFTYLTFEMYQNIWKIQKAKNQNGEILENWESTSLSHQSLEVMNQRLLHLEDINITNLKKYTVMLDNFYALFLKN